MSDLIPPKHSTAALVAITLILVVAASNAQFAPNPPPPEDQYQCCGPTLPDEPQIFDSGSQRFRVVALKGLFQPWSLAFLPNGDMLITERPGRLRIVRNGVLDPQAIAGIPQVSNIRDKGLQDIALHPRFAENRLVYFTYYKLKPGEKDVSTATLARGRFDGGTVLTEVRDLFVADAWTSSSSAAAIAFGRDGKLYMAVGIPIRSRVGTADSAQDPSNHAGKVLRLNDDGSAPPDNPFVGQAGYRPEIYALGIRNAVALVIHPETGELWLTDNGPQGGDEVNVIRPGRNYGWPVISFGRAYSGDLTGGTSGPTSEQPCAPGMEQPFLFWAPSISISGMAFYTGNQFPAWKRSLFVGGLVGKQLQRVTLNNRGLPQRRESLLTELKQRIRAVKQGPDGLLYLLTSENDGALLRIEPVSAGTEK